MADALYLGMMGGINFQSAKDKKRAKRNKILSAIGKGILYAGSIVMAAYGAEDVMANMTVASALCAALECLR